MKGQFNAGRRPTLKKRLESLRRQNRAISHLDAANRCPTCKAPLPVPAFTLFGHVRQYCSVICLPTEAS